MSEIVFTQFTGIRSLPDYFRTYAVGGRMGVFERALLKHPRFSPELRYYYIY